jgi:hypothetical protein
MFICLTCSELIAAFVQALRYLCVLVVLLHDSAQHPLDHTCMYYTPLPLLCRFQGQRPASFHATPRRPPFASVWLSGDSEPTAPVHSSSSSNIEGAMRNAELSTAGCSGRGRRVVAASGSSSTLQQAAIATAETVAVPIVVAVPSALCSSPSVLSTGSVVSCDPADVPTAQSTATVQNASICTVAPPAVAPASTEAVAAAVAAAAKAMQSSSSHHQDREKQAGLRLQCDRNIGAAAESASCAASNAAVTSTDCLNKSDNLNDVIHGSSGSSFTAAPREEGLVNVRPSDWQHAESLAREQELLRRQTHSVATAAAAAAAAVVVLTQLHQLRQSLA